MYGLQAISAANGWAQAATGAVIVLSGLGVLSFVISRISLLIDYWEKRQARATQQTAGATPPPQQEPVLKLPDDPLQDPEQTAHICRLLAADLDEAFELKELFALLKTAGDVHPHLTVSALRNHGLLVSAQQGRFSWAQS